MPAEQSDKAGMTKYEVTRTGSGWTIFHDGVAEVSLETKTAAFDSAVTAAVTSLHSGLGVVIQAASETPAGDAASAARTTMPTYEIMRRPDGWAVMHDANRETVLDSKMAAFDAAVSAAVGSMGSGLGAIIRVPAAPEEQSLPRD
jgi:hypothetical protein